MAVGMSDEHFPATGVDAEYLLETFLENTPDHMYIKDLDGRLTQVSASLGRWMGFDDPQRAVGLTDFDIFAASHAASARAAELEIMRTGVPVVGIEESEEWPDGRATWVSTTKLPLWENTMSVLRLVSWIHEYDRSPALSLPHNTRSLAVSGKLRINLRACDYAKRNFVRFH